MNAIINHNLPAIGSAMPGGFFAGAIMMNGERFAVIKAPKNLAHFSGSWNDRLVDVPGARSYFDGLANTQAMAEAGSESAKRILALEFDGLQDFHIPSQDELEICYRAFKPTTEKNWCHVRSGINLSAATPTYPYTPDFPEQTILDAFKAGGEEAFDDAAYWSSTQHAGSSVYAWYQDFRDGSQHYDHKSYELLVCAVRRQPI